jgi:hypothetical protein
VTLRGCRMQRVPCRVLLGRTPLTPYGISTNSIMLHLSPLIEYARRIIPGHNLISDTSSELSLESGSRLCVTSQTWYSVPVSLSTPEQAQSNMVTATHCLETSGLSSRGLSALRSIMPKTFKVSVLANMLRSAPSILKFSSPCAAQPGIAVRRNYVRCGYLLLGTQNLEIPAKARLHSPPLCEAPRLDFTSKQCKMNLDYTFMLGSDRDEFANRSKCK